MNIKVITRHGPSNYGSLLQSIATVKVLKQLGYDVSIIDYQRKDERGYGIIRSQLKTKDKIANPIKKVAYAIIRYPVEKFAQIKFDKMRTRWLPMTKRVSDYRQLEELKADIFMTGSDQVWGPTMSGNYDPAYFLKFVDNETPKVAYAASFGKTKFGEETINAYKQLLSRYDKIAVREESAVSILRDWGLKNSVGQVLDPTLLLNSEEWDSTIHFTDTNHNKGKRYILLYLIHGNSSHIDYAKRMAKETGMQLINVNPFFHRVLNAGHFICCPDVAEFLSLINEATFMITDSFHGTCFAINLNKQFVELLPHNGTSTRNQSILGLTNLTNRIVSDLNDLNWEDRIIDYSHINDILSKERNKSINIIKDLIEE